MERKERIQLNIVKKLLYFLPKLLYNMLNFLCIALIAIIVMQRFSDSNKSLGGYKIFEVVSGSMVPKYDIGEVVICKETPVEDIKIGNAIVYRGKLGELNGKIVMHEVIAINQDENNELKFYAKGLYNSKGDPEISETQILGVVKFRSSILTLLHKLASNVYVIFIIIATLIVDLFFSFKTDKEQEYIEKQTNKKRKRRKVVIVEETSDEEYDMEDYENEDIENDEDIEYYETENDVDIEEFEYDEEINGESEEIEELEEQELVNEVLQNKIDNMKRKVKENNKKKEEFDKKVTKQSKNKTLKNTNSKTKKVEKNVIDTKKESDKIKNRENNIKKKSEINKETKKSNTQKTGKNSKKQEKDAEKSKKIAKKD